MDEGRRYGPAARCKWVYRASARSPSRTVRLALAIDGNVLNSPNTPFVGIGTNVGGVGHLTVEGTGSMLQRCKAW